MHFSILSNRNAIKVSSVFIKSQKGMCSCNFSYYKVILKHTLILWTMVFLEIFFFIVSGVRLSPLGTAATTGLLYQPQLIDDGDCGEIGGIKTDRGNRSTRRKPAPAPLCPPQIPHDQTGARTRAAAVGSQRLTS
jgi:hypothetical protein